MGVLRSTMEKYKCCYWPSYYTNEPHYNWKKSRPRYSSVSESEIELNYQLAKLSIDQKEERRRNRMSKKLAEESIQDAYDAVKRSKAYLDLIKTEEDKYGKIYKYRSVYPYINTYSDNLIKYRRKGTISDWDHVEPIYDTAVDLRYTNPNIYTDKLVIHKHYHPY